MSSITDIWNGCSLTEKDLEKGQTVISSFKQWTPQDSENELSWQSLWDIISAVPYEARLRLCGSRAREIGSNETFLNFIAFLLDELASYEKQQVGVVMASSLRAVDLLLTAERSENKKLAQNARPFAIRYSSDEQLNELFDASLNQGTTRIRDLVTACTKSRRVFPLEKNFDKLGQLFGIKWTARLLNHLSVPFVKTKFASFYENEVTKEELREKQFWKYHFETIFEYFEKEISVQAPLTISHSRLVKSAILMDTHVFAKHQERFLKLILQYPKMKVVNSSDACVLQSITFDRAFELLKQGIVTDSVTTNYCGVHEILQRFKDPQLLINTIKGLMVTEHEYTTVYMTDHFKALVVAYFKTQPAIDEVIAMHRLLKTVEPHVKIDIKRHLDYLKKPDSGEDTHFLAMMEIRPKPVVRDNETDIDRLARYTTELEAEMSYFRNITTKRLTMNGRRCRVEERNLSFFNSRIAIVKELWEKKTNLTNQMAENGDMQVKPKWINDRYGQVCTIYYTILRYPLYIERTKPDVIKFVEDFLLPSQEARYSNFLTTESKLEWLTKTPHGYFSSSLCEKIALSYRNNIDNCISYLSEGQSFPSHLSFKSSLFQKFATDAYWTNPFQLMKINETPTNEFGSLMYSIFKRLMVFRNESSSVGNYKRIEDKSYLRFNGTAEELKIHKQNYYSVWQALCLLPSHKCVDDEEQVVNALSSIIFNKCSLSFDWPSIGETAATLSQQKYYKKEIVHKVLDLSGKKFIKLQGNEKISILKCIPLQEEIVRSSVEREVRFCNDWDFRFEWFQFLILSTKNSGDAVEVRKTFKYLETAIKNENVRCKVEFFSHFNRYLSGFLYIDTKEGTKIEDVHEQYSSLMFLIKQSITQPGSQAIVPSLQALVTSYLSALWSKLDSSGQWTEVFQATLDFCLQVQIQIHLYSHGSMIDSKCHFSTPTQRITTTETSILAANHYKASLEKALKEYSCDADWLGPCLDIAGTAFFDEPCFIEKINEWMKDWDSEEINTEQSPRNKNALKKSKGKQKNTSDKVSSMNSLKQKVVTMSNNLWWGHPILEPFVLKFAVMNDNYQIIRKKYESEARSTSAQNMKKLNLKYLQIAIDMADKDKSCLYDIFSFILLHRDDLLADLLSIHDNDSIVTNKDIYKHVDWEDLRRLTPEMSDYLATLLENVILDQKAALSLRINSIELLRQVYSVTFKNVKDLIHKIEDNDSDEERAFNTEPLVKCLIASLGTLDSPKESFTFLVGAREFFDLYDKDCVAVLQSLSLQLNPDFVQTSVDKILQRQSDDHYFGIAMLKALIRLSAIQVESCGPILLREWKRPTIHRDIQITIIEICLNVLQRDIKLEGDEVWQILQNLISKEVLDPRILPDLLCPSLAPNGLLAICDKERYVKQILLPLSERPSEVLKVYSLMCKLKDLDQETKSLLDTRFWDFVKDFEYALSFDSEDVRKFESEIIPIVIDQSKDRFLREILPHLLSSFRNMPLFEIEKVKILARRIKFAKSTLDKTKYKMTKKEKEDLFKDHDKICSQMKSNL